MALLLGMLGDKKPIAGIEDTAVAPERLADYIARLDDIVRSHGAEAAYYGHASVGCLHIRPIIDLKQDPEVEKLRSIAEQVSDLVLEFGGAMSAEHGDGLARSCWNEKLFGPTLYQAFRELKAAFDPRGIMNPGKIVDVPPMTANLRYGGKYKARQVKTFFSFSRQGGIEVILADKKCCGRPMISKGLILQAKQNAAYNVDRLFRYAEQGIPIVGLEPSCILTFRDEYPDLVDDPRAETLAKGVFLIEEFLLGLHQRGELQLPFASGARSILLHGHCHQKALIGSSPSLQLLQLLPEAQVEEVDSGCCGMAGSFGYEKEHYEISLAIGNRRLFPAIKTKAPDCEIVAAGVSCRQQIAHGTGRRAKHLVEVLAEALV